MVFSKYTPSSSFSKTSTQQYKSVNSENSSFGRSEIDDLTTERIQEAWEKFRTRHSVIQVTLGKFKNDEVLKEFLKAVDALKNTKGLESGQKRPQNWTGGHSIPEEWSAVVIILYSYLFGNQESRSAIKEVFGNGHFVYDFSMLRKIVNNSIAFRNSKDGSNNGIIVDVLSKFFSYMLEGKTNEAFGELEQLMATKPIPITAFLLAFQTVDSHHESDKNRNLKNLHNIAYLKVIGENGESFLSEAMKFELGSRKSRNNKGIKWRHLFNRSLVEVRESGKIYYASIMYLILKLATNSTIVGLCMSDLGRLLKNFSNPTPFYQSTAPQILTVKVHGSTPQSTLKQKKPSPYRSVELSGLSQLSIKT
jgi:hypothetical protein